jgi:phosphoglycerate dehydrogenase-like enzyme
VLILGLGAIGEEVARLCRALGARTLATRRSVTIACEFPATTRNSPCDELHPAGSLHALLPRADFVVVATPGTSETAALIGAPELELMRCVPTALHPPAVAPEASGAPGGRRPSLPTAASFARSSSAVLINVSRGSTVDWAALSVALRAESGAGIAACYTDVAPTEPLPADDPLWGVPNLVRAAPATRPAVASSALCSR